MGGMPVTISLFCFQTQKPLWNKSTHQPRHSAQLSSLFPRKSPGYHHASAKGHPGHACPCFSGLLFLLQPLPEALAWSPLCHGNPPLGSSALRVSVPSAGSAGTPFSLPPSQH